METLCQSNLLTTNPLGNALELWQESQQEMPEGHEAEAQEEAEGAPEVGHQGVQAVDSCLSRHLFTELSKMWIDMCVKKVPLSGHLSLSDSLIQLFLLNCDEEEQTCLRRSNQTSTEEPMDQTEKMKLLLILVVR